MNFDVVVDRITRWQAIAFLKMFAGLVINYEFDLVEAISVEIVMTNFGEFIPLNREPNEHSREIRFEMLTDVIEPGHLAKLERGVRQTLLETVELGVNAEEF